MEAGGWRLEVGGCLINYLTKCVCYFYIANGDGAGDGDVVGGGVGVDANGVWVL